jgi:glycerol-1-phosphate dehydrogenase [NAD(P)+]
VQQLAARIGAAPAYVVMDANTRAAAGAAVAAALPGAEPIVFEQRHGLLATPEQSALVSARARAGVPLIAVGSGVITDIVRYAARGVDAAFISVPTAASMDGYASSVAAMQIDGVKVTEPARAPDAIFAAPDVLAAAPQALTRAGIGDLLGKATAGVDWLAAHLLYGEAYDPAVAASVQSLVHRTCADVDRLLRGDAEAARALLLSLIESGLAITAVGNSRPASGCEHHASHLWDLLAARGERPHQLHGLQVGYATHVAMRLQRFAFGGGVATLHEPVDPADPLGASARVLLGEPTDDVRAAVREKLQFTRSGRPRWPRDEQEWDDVQATLAPALAPFADVARALETAGIPSTPGFLGIEETLLRATFRTATRLRSRYTVLDFLEGQGRLDQALLVALGGGV